jgi:hypothetical protein
MVRAKTRGIVHLFHEISRGDMEQACQHLHVDRQPDDQNVPPSPRETNMKHALFTPHTLAMLPGSPPAGYLATAPGFARACNNTLDAHKRPANTGIPDAGPTRLSPKGGDAP